MSFYIQRQYIIGGLYTMRDEIISELWKSESFLARFLEEALKNREMIVEKEGESIKISTKGMTMEILMALVECRYMLERAVDNTRVHIRTDMEYIYFSLK